MNIQVEYIEVSELNFYQNNARTHSDSQVEQLVSSIQEFGFTNPVLIDENNTLIAGHGRTTAAGIIGLSKVPAIRLTGLSESQIKALAESYRTKGAAFRAKPIIRPDRIYAEWQVLLCRSGGAITVPMIDLKQVSKIDAANDPCIDIKMRA